MMTESVKLTPLKFAPEEPNALVEPCTTVQTMLLEQTVPALVKSLSKAVFTLLSSLFSSSIPLSKALVAVLTASMDESASFVSKTTTENEAGAKHSLTFDKKENQTQKYNIYCQNLKSAQLLRKV